MTNLDTDLIDLLDLIDYTLSQKFVDNWKFKFSEVFLKNFQEIILSSFRKQKPIKIKTLVTLLKKNNKYSETQILTFFDSININLYRPIIQGSL